MSLATLGFVGVGRMGGPMTERLLAVGYHVIVYDKSQEAMARLADKGARPAPSAKAVADQCEIVLTSLPTPDILQTVMLGPDGVSSGSKVKTVIDLSTSGPKAAALVAQGLAEKGVDWVDSPVSGGVKRAEAGNLAVMISCKPGKQAEVEPILGNFGKIFYVGPRPGAAQVAKLANNILAAGVMVMTSEVMAMGVKSGLDPSTLLQIIQTGSGANTAAGDKFPRCVLTGAFDFGFAVGLSYKDVRLCVDEAEALGVPMVAGAAVRQMLAITNAKFGADSDFTNIAKVVEEWAGVQSRA
jgi:3-hydroxyisobutyrate dehydrogenase-like beta-hydroxyacid dehydrogenase